MSGEHVDRQPMNTAVFERSITVHDGHVSATDDGRVDGRVEGWMESWKVRVAGWTNLRTD